MRFTRGVPHAKSVAQWHSSKKTGRFGRGVAQLFFSSAPDPPVRDERPVVC